MIGLRPVFTASKHPDCTYVRNMLHRAETQSDGKGGWTVLVPYPDYPRAYDLVWGSKRETAESFGFRKEKG